MLATQQPATPPAGDLEGKSWLRARVGVPYRETDSLGALVRFLDAIAPLAGAPGMSVHLHEVPQMTTVDATQNADEDPFDRYGVFLTPRQLGANRRPAFEHDLLPERPPFRPVCLLVHAPVRVGFVCRTLCAVSEAAPMAEVLAVEAGDFHGLSVLFLTLCNGTASSGADAKLARGIRERLRRTDPGAEVAPHVSFIGADRTDAAWVRSPEGDSIPLLRVSIRTPDYPGCLQLLMDELHRSIEETTGVLTAGGLNLLMTHTQVVDGTLMSAKFIVRLPPPQAAPEQPPLWLEDAGWRGAERRLTATLDRAAPAGIRRPWNDGILVRLSILDTRG
jgi:hypothetical protein